MTLKSQYRLAGYGLRKLSSSLLLWCFVINGLQKILNGSYFYGQAYIYSADVVSVISDKKIRKHELRHMWTAP